MWKIKQPIATDLATGGSHEITSFYRVGGTAFLVGKVTEKVYGMEQASKFSVFNTHNFIGKFFLVRGFIFVAFPVSSSAEES